MNHRLYLWLSGFLEIADGLAKVMTLGYWLPSWSFDFCCWQAMRMMEREIANECQNNYPL